MRGAEGDTGASHLNCRHDSTWSVADQYLCMQMAQLLMSCVLPAILLLSGVGGVSGQDYDYEHQQEVNLCDSRPHHEPNGEHLGSPGDDLVVYVNWTNNNPTQAHHCRMRFTTCNSCRLHVRANASFYYDPCRSAQGYDDYQGWCVPGCTYVHLYDKDYSSHLASSFTSSSSTTGEYPPILDFVTESRYLYVIACANKTMDPHVQFRLRIFAEDKMQYFGGRHWEIGQPFSFTSPFFPAEYVLNSEIYKYVFQADAHDDFITVSFDDWHLSPFSSILFDRANIKSKIWGSTSRPWIVSDKDRLEMTFETGPYRITGRSLMGFKATYMFHKRMDRDTLPYVQTNCGQWVELQESGQITFNPNGDGKEYYDCIWVIKKHPSYERVMIKVTSYHTQDNTYRSKQPNILEVREGLTSQGRLVITAVPDTSPKDEQVFQDYDSRVGFYVRLKGRYGGREDFVMSFISYNLDECRDLFWCQNGRCITTDVLCNQIDNCGDYSDEQDSVCGTVPTTAPSGSNAILSPVIIIPIVVAMFIIVIICLLAIFIRRCRRLSCQARQARRQQQRISTVSGSVSRQQRRHNRRRGERRANGSADQYHLHHDPPPSYEDVLNATPIGYLNLGYMDHPNPTTGLIQPPSYDEAMSPTTPGPTLAFPVGEPQDESSDSSLPETVQRSLSSSYSSDDTQRGVADQHRHRQAVSSSSSDSSNDGEVLRGEGGDRRGRRVSDGQRDRQEVRQPEGRQRSTAPGVAKPEDSQGPVPVCPSAVIAHNKVVVAQDKPGDGQDNEDRAPAVIMQSSAAASTVQSLPGPQSEGQPSLVCQVEASPIISPPSASPPASHEGHGAHARYEDDEEGASSARSGAACLLSPAHSPHVSRTQPRCTAMEGEPFAHQREDSSSSREAQGRPSPGRRVPPHVLKARNPSSHMLMKHLSRSMNDLDRQSSDSRSHQQHGSMPLREFSRSMQNILEAESGTHHRGRDHHSSERHRYNHDRSQTLPTSRGMLNDTGTPEGRNSFFPPDGQARRARSADMADQSHVHPDTLQRDRPLHKAEEGTSLSTTRPKPKPKPRRFQQAEERPRPEPKQRQLSGGPRYPDQAGNRDIPSTDRSQLPEEHRPGRQRNSWGKNVDGLNFPRADQRRAGSSDGCQQPEAGHPHENKNGNRQTTPGYQEREDPRRAKTNRPPAPPRPDGASRSSASRGHDLPKPDTTGSGNNRNGYNFSREPPPSGSSHSQKSSPPYRHADPPPYRPRDPSGPSRPPLHSPTRHAQPSPPSDHGKADAGSFSPPERATRGSPSAHFGQVPRSAGPVPRMGAQWLPRSEQHSVGVHSRDPGQGSVAGSSRAEGGDGPMTPHRPARPHATTLDGSLVVTSPETAGSGASAPHLSLQLGGLDGNEVEDVYV